MPLKSYERLKVPDIIAGINSKLRESQTEVEFDNGPTLTTNRGNKLKRKAATAHEGRLGGQGPYKKRVTHAGFDRHILHRKPLRYDESGELLDSGEEDEDADTDAAARDPYNGVDIQALLMPLTAASDLWRHPGMSNALTSQALTDMVSRTREMLRKERQTLSLIKEMATRLRGDHIRAPSLMVLAENDIDLFSTDAILRGLPEIDLVGPNDHTPEPAVAVNVVAADEVKMNGAKEERAAAENASTIEGHAEPATMVNGVAGGINTTIEAPSTGDPEQGGEEGTNSAPRNGQNDPETVNGHGTPADTDPNGGGIPQTDGAASPSEQNGGDDDMQGDAPAPRMVTRGAAAAANGTSHEHDPDKPRSLSPPLSLPAIHPTFIPPISTIPDRDLGLPPWEAEETRKLTNVFVQKQEEVVRGVEKLYSMFLKAEKIRKTVYWWSRAEAHKGEMSDGEEWVDQEEWNLDAPLRKGAAEGEEEGREEERKGKGRRTRAVDK